MRDAQCMKTLPRPETTLYMLMSVDGKISTGDTDERDFDVDLPTITGAKEGLPQYYELEKQTDAVSFNTGRCMAKIGVNTRPLRASKIDCDFVIVDNQPHLTDHGLAYLRSWVKHLYIVTTNPQHPALNQSHDDLTVISYIDDIDLPHLFAQLKSVYGMARMTIQSGGTMNTALVRAGLIDHVTIVVAPVLIGGRDTSTLLDGPSLQTVEDLNLINSLRLRDVQKLKDSYLLIQYDVVV